jgi:hypothetical protein
VAASKAVADVRPSGPECGSSPKRAVFSAAEVQRLRPAALYAIAVVALAAVGAISLGGRRPRSLWVSDTTPPHVAEDDPANVVDDGV